MISSNCLNGVPLLVLANKQDIPDSMGVREVKPIFNQSAHLIGRRDCMVMPVSALTGYGNIILLTSIHKSVSRNTVKRWIITETTEYTELKFCCS
jgi:ADP-ribosylation factor related protein 1